MKTEQLAIVCGSLLLVVALLVGLTLALVQMGQAQLARSILAAAGTGALVVVLLYGFYRMAS